MKKILLSVTVALFLSACSSDDGKNADANLLPVAQNKVLLLKVDYTTNQFECGKELEFEGESDAFNVSVDYQQPNDFGNIRIVYNDLDEKLFEGSIHWMGLGNISFPENLIPANGFAFVDTEDFAICAGIENVFNPQNQEFDYSPVWNSIQGMVKVREYLQSNPTATVKLFLYTPSVGVGNPEEWDWIVMLKN